MLLKKIATKKLYNKSFGKPTSTIKSIRNKILGKFDIKSTYN